MCCVGVIFLSFLFFLFSIAEESEFALCTLRRQDAISSAKFPEMKDPSEDDRIDLTGVRLTTRCPAEDDEEVLLFCLAIQL